MCHPAAANFLTAVTKRYQSKPNENNRVGKVRRRYNFTRYRYNCNRVAKNVGKTPRRYNFNRASNIIRSEVATRLRRNRLFF